MSEIDWIKAPDWATHYCSAHKAWRNSVIDTIGDCCMPLPRPTKQEWEGGLPEDGELVTVSDDEASPGVYFLCEFQADGPRFQEHPEGGCFYPDEISIWNSTGIRIKSPHERQREEMYELVSGAVEHGDRCPVLDAVDAILSRYNLEEK